MASILLGVPNVHPGSVSGMKKAVTWLAFNINANGYLAFSTTRQKRIEKPRTGTSAARCASRVSYLEVHSQQCQEVRTLLLSPSASS